MATASLSLSVSIEEAAAIEGAAKATGVTTSMWLKRAALAALPILNAPETEAAAAAQRLSDALLAEPATAERFDGQFAHTAATPVTGEPDNLRDAGGRA